METHMDARRTLYVIWWCGLTGVLVDTDHLVSLLLWRFWNPQITEGRIWHAPLLLLSSIIICCLCAFGTRLHLKYFLGMGIVVAVTTALLLMYSPLVVWGLTR